MLTVKEAARRYNCSETAFRHKVRARQIDPKYVDRSGRSIRIRPELFTVQETTSNVIPFSRAFDEVKLGRVIAENLATNSDFCRTMMAALLDSFLRDTTARTA
jgi:hypothetical protein